MPRTLLGRIIRHSLIVRRRSTGLAVEPMEPRVLLATYTVLSTADDGSAGTLRWALTQVNSSAGPDTVAFDLPGSGTRVITIKSPLPAINTPVTIDGTSQPGYAGTPLVQLDGSQAGAGSAGLVLSGGSSLVQGLAITGFAGAAIVLENGGGNQILGNELGTSPAGTAANANGEGLQILGSSNNSIGGVGTGMGNLISGNLGAGVDIVATTQPATGNTIVGNLIGTTADGMHPLPNQGCGILVSGASGNLIGGPALGAGNVISGNLGAGVKLTSGAAKNVLAGNFIGTTADGKAVLGNGADGVLLDGAPSNTVGGSDPGDGNVISGNQGNGIGTDGLAQANLIEGNSIGTDLTGVLGLGNLANGISLASSGNTVGGLNSGAGNTIAYNGTGSVGAGVLLVGQVDHDEITSNSIHDNAGLGINMGDGPTANHQPGSGPGPNDFQNYPILAIPVTTSQATTITGNLLGQPSSSYTVQLFWSPLADPSGFGEGQHLLSTIQVATNSQGNASFSPTLPTTPPGAVISATATDGSGNTSEFSPDVQIKGVTDLDVSIVAAPSPVGTGGTLTYTVSVTNTGSLDAHEVKLTDQLPGGVTIVSVSSSQGTPTSTSGHSITVVMGTVGAGATATLTIVATVQSSPGTILSDSATATLEETDPTPGNNIATITTPVMGLADLAVMLAASSGTVAHGQSLTYTITAWNIGPAQATNVTIALPLASSWTFTSATASQGTASFDNGQLTANLGTLLPGAGATVTVLVQASAAGKFTSTATISSDDSDPVPANNTSSTTVTILPVVDLGVSIAANPSPVAMGQTLVYTLTATNQGPDTASAVTVSDIIPAGVTFVSVSSNAGNTPTQAKGIVTAVLGDLSPGASATVLVTVVPTVPPGSNLVDLAAVSSPELDSNPANNTATLSVPVRVVSDLAVIMSPSASSVPIGQNITYFLVVANDGPAEEPDAIVSIPLPLAVSIVSCTASQGSSVVSQGAITIDLGAVGNGGSATITVTVSPQAAALGALTMTALAQGYNADVEPEQSQASATVTVAPAADLSVALAPQSAPAYQDMNASYTIAVSNAGPSAATGVSVSAPLPAGVSFVSASSSQGSQPFLQNGQITASLGSIDSGKSAAVTVFINAPMPSASGLSLSASATADPFDPHTANNVGLATMPVLPSDDLSLSLVSDQGSSQVGTNLGLTATVLNAGPSAAAGVVLSFPLTAGARFISISPNTVQTSIQGGVLLAQVGALGPGPSSPITLTIQPGTAGTTRYSASVSGTTNDLNLANNQAAASVNVAESPGVLQFARPTEVVDDTAGVAVITVTRTVGTGGAVTVHYRTGGGNAVPGLDYTPIAGTLSFADGQASQTIVVPILNNLHNRHDMFVGLTLDTPTQGAALGTQTSSVLQIHDVNPDLTPPQVTGLTWNGWAGGITSIILSFSEPIQTAAAINPQAYAVADLGTSGLAAPAASAIQPIGFSPPVYNPATDSVTLVPTAPLAAGHFYRIIVSGSGADPLVDLAGNPLAGAGPGLAGTSYVALIGQGTSLRYDDSNGDVVSLHVTGGGYLDLTRAANGEGLILALEGGVVHRTVITGSVVRARGKAGTTTLQTIEGLGQFGQIRVKLNNPPFQIRAYPFFLSSGKSLVARRAVTAKPAHVPKPAPRLVRARTASTAHRR